MYEHFYGLRERAFALTPDPAFLLLAARHRETLSLIEYALSGRTGLVLLLGEAGSGKTMLLRAALEPRKPRDRLVVLDNPLLTRDEFFEFVAEGFGLGKEARGSKTRLLSGLNGVLGDRQTKGGRSALVVDEAHTLSDELLEEIRLLANLESQSARRLPIVLAGQPDLAERLNDPAMGPLKQRVEFRAVLTPLTLAETADYIAGRLRVAGGDIAQTFTRSAVEAVFVGSEGIPRTISVICESALVTGFAVEARPIDRDVVIEVCRDLDVWTVETDAPAARAGPVAVATPTPVPPRPARLAPDEEGAAPGAGSVVGGRPSLAVWRPAARRGMETEGERPVDAEGPGDVERPAAPEPQASPAPAAVPLLRRPALRLLPSLWPRPRRPLELKVQSFEANHGQGILITPAGQGSR